MTIVVFGLTVSSSWGNGHATLWRGLIKALSKRGHRVIFFGRDVPYYANARDVWELPGDSQLHLYRAWAAIEHVAATALANADVAIITSYCPDAQAASDVVLQARTPLKVFYDLDTPVTLAVLSGGGVVPYLPTQGLGAFDLVLSYTGGRALKELRALGARAVEALYGHVDPDTHHRVAAQDGYRCDLSYLGTYAPDRQPALEALLIAPARKLSRRRFLIGGAQYPTEFPWADNIFFVRHLPPTEHSAFFSSSRLTLNITRAAMAASGFCPSGRLFEAAACGTPVITDAWEGQELFFAPGSEMLVARTSEDVMSALEMPDAALERIGRAARDRVFDEHTSYHRAVELERIVERALGSMGPAAERRGCTWGIVPAAGRGSRIQPLAFSKELLPVGSRPDGGIERPRAVSEYLVDRMIKAGARKICFLIAPGKADILNYYGASLGDADFCYVVQPHPAGLCDALFRAAPFVQAADNVLVGLPDTIWFPEDGLSRLRSDRLAFLLFPVDKPSAFDVVLIDELDNVREIQVKPQAPASHWVWGAFSLPGHVFHALHRLWQQRDGRDEYVGTLVNAYLAQGGKAVGLRAGESYVDVGTLNGFREATRLLLGQGGGAAPPATPSYDARPRPEPTPNFADGRAVDPHGARS